MPYEIRKVDDEYCVFNTDTGENKGCSETREEAEKHMEALYANAEDTKSLEVIQGNLEEKSVSLERQLASIQRSFYKAFPDIYFSYYVLDTYDDDNFLVVEEFDTGKCFKVAYEKAPDENISFTEKDSWIEVEYVPLEKTLDPELKTGYNTIVQSLKNLIDSFKSEEEEPKSDFFTIKQKDGRFRWMSISSTAFLDREREIVAREGVDKSIQRAKSLGYGPLRFWHTPGTDLGECDFQMRDGVCLIESGLWYDTPEALAARNTVSRSKSWGISIGFYGLQGKPAIINGIDVKNVWTDIQIIERSVLPENRAATEGSMVTTVGDEMMDKEKMSALEELVGARLAKTMASRVDAVNAKSTEPDAVFKESGETEDSFEKLIGDMGDSPFAQRLKVLMENNETELPVQEDKDEETLDEKDNESEEDEVSLKEVLVALKEVGDHVAQLGEDVEKLKNDTSPKVADITLDMLQSKLGETPSSEPTSFISPVVRQMTSQILSAGN